MPGMPGTNLTRDEASLRKGLINITSYDVTLDLKTLRKDMMSAVATGALSGTAMPLSTGVLTALSAAVAQGWGDKDIGELARFFREHMGQKLS